MTAHLTVQIESAGAGVFAQPGMEPPQNALFKQLRDVWVAQDPSVRNFSRLADALSELSSQTLGQKIATQNISQWATGSDGRKPPWWVIMMLCHLTGYQLVATAQSWRVEAPSVA